MLKVFSLIKRREDLPLDEFREWVFERHAPMGKQLPGLREYHVSVVEQDDPDLPYHAVTELYFDDEDAFKEAFASEARAERRATTWRATPPGACGCSRGRSASSEPRTPTALVGLGP